MPTRSLNLFIFATLTVLSVSISGTLLAFSLPGSPCCEGLGPHSALAAMGGVTLGYHIFLAIIDCGRYRQRLPASHGRRNVRNSRSAESITSEYPMSYATIWGLVTLSVFWVWWMVFLPIFVTVYRGMYHVDRTPYYKPSMVLHAVEVPVLTGLWIWSFLNRRWAGRVSE